MAFTNLSYAAFILIVFIVYWAVRRKSIQNLLLVAASYYFYGCIHPWFCLLIATSTIADYICGLMLRDDNRSSVQRKAILIVSLIVNLGLLGVFKYFNFFVANVSALLTDMGLGTSQIALQIALPVGISFYTFQTLSYTIDVYQRKIKPCDDFIDFALFVSFFPQLVAGPIERASRLLPQITMSRVWVWERFWSAIPLIVGGYFKKLVVADNLAGYADMVFMLEKPSASVLAAGTFAFALQIFADFSAYTDIARGSARLLGIDLMENFNSPYLAITPSDFWRRWHISLSNWIRDYLYIPLGGSRVSSTWKFFLVVMITMGLCGLWHGAAWHFVAWGIYHGLLLFIYHKLGMAGKWQPGRWWQWFLCFIVMTILTMFGWAIFRAPDLAWLGNVMSDIRLGLGGDDLLAAAVIVGYCIAYGGPWFIWFLIRRIGADNYWLQVLAGWAILGLILLLANHDPQQFIYFQF